MTLAEVAALVSGEVRGDAAAGFDRIAAIDDAGPGALTFATDERYLRGALASRAVAVLVDAAIAPAAAPPGGPSLVVVPSARAALPALLRSLDRPLPRGPYRHPTAAVDETASVGPDVYVGAQVVVGARARIGADCVLLAGAIVGDDAVLGRGCVLRQRAMLLDRCVAGDRVVLQAGAVVGSDGFGFVPTDEGLAKIPQVGDVRLADDVEIGSNTCVDRAQTGSTTIGRGTKIDNLVQVGHNVRVGGFTAIAAMVGLAGSCEIGDGTVIGGQSAVNGHIRVGSRVRVAGNTMVWSPVADGATVSGQPAQAHRDELKSQVRIRGLAALYARVAALERA